MRLPNRWSHCYWRVWLLVVWPRAILVEISNTHGKVSAYKSLKLTYCFWSKFSHRKDLKLTQNIELQIRHQSHFSFSVAKCNAAFNDFLWWWKYNMPFPTCWFTYRCTRQDRTVIRAYVRNTSSGILENSLPCTWSYICSNDYGLQFQQRRRLIIQFTTWYICMHMLNLFIFCCIRRAKIKNKHAKCDMWIDKRIAQIK